MMESLYEKHQNPVTLYLAPNCGLKIAFNTKTYNPEFGFEYELTNVNDFPLTSKPKEVRGWLSPMRLITLPNDIKPVVGIPIQATRFSYLYPPLGLADYIDWNKATLERKSSGLKEVEETNKWALPFIASFGAYAYFNEDNELLGVNAISLKETQFQLNFEGPFIATNDSHREIKDLNRYQSLCLDVFGEIGFVGLAWIDPGEDKYIDATIDGQAETRNHHGGFLYFRHDGSAVIFLIDVDDALFTPHLGIGSLIRDAFRLCKYQVQMKSISTTCAAIEQTNDEIHRACEDGSIELVTYLLKQAHSPTEALYKQDNFGWTPLHYAACYNAQNDELIQVLLEGCPGAALITNNNGLCPIHLACHNNPSLKVIKMLLECDTNKKTIHMKSKHLGLLPIHFACSNSMSSIEVIRLLILADSEGTAINATSILGSSTLCIAISGNCSYNVIELLLSSVSNTESSFIKRKVNGLFPLHLACLKSCSSDTVALLMKADDEDEIFYQIVDGCYEYKILNSSVLHIALAHSSKEVIDLVLIKEVKTRCMPSKNVTDLLMVPEKSLGKYPIHIACSRYDLNPETINTVMCLKRESVLYKDYGQNTPLHLVCCNSNATQEVIRMLLNSEKEVARTAGKKEISFKSVAKSCNDKKQTPLILAIRSKAEGANVLLEPEHICLKYMNYEAKDRLLELILSRTDMQENLVNNLAERQYFALIMLELVANIVATLLYFNASTGSLDNEPIGSISFYILIWCIFTFASRELIQLKGSSLLDYIFDGWNWIECSSIALLIASTIHMVQLRDQVDMAPNSNLFTWTGVLLVMQFIFIIRTTFLPFARFVAGLLAIALTLIPFFVVSAMVLVAFTYSFFMSGGREEECPSLSRCFLWTLEGFFFGMNDFMKTPILDVLFGILAAVILLNVVIAIVSNAWDDSIVETKEVFWKSRIDVLFQYRFFKGVIGKKSYFASWLSVIDDFDVFANTNRMPTWKRFLSFILYFIWFALGLVTFGLFWPQSIRRKILSTGMKLSE